MIGVTYNRLTVISEVAKELRPVQTKGRYFVCECTCGGKVVVRKDHLQDGNTKSCGCLDRENLKSGCNRTIHGMSGSKVYISWKGMVRRCTDKSQFFYKYYGGKGITVCERWLKFENFLEDMGEPEEGFTIERKNVHEDYTPENCIWIRKEEQCNNRSNTLYLEVEGITKTLKEWSGDLQVSYQLLYWRLKQGWSPLTILIGKGK